MPERPKSPTPLASEPMSFTRYSLPLNVAQAGIVNGPLSVSVAARALFSTPSRGKAALCVKWPYRAI